MLLRFGVENFRSIKERQELSLVASSLDDVTTGLITTPALPKERLLPAVIIYGANAAGKSNIVSAFNWMRNAVLHSHSRGEPGAPLKISPFLLDEEWTAKPTTFDMDFILDDVRYQYGFEASKEAFLAEWLFAYPNDRRQVLFERHGLEFSFGRSLKGQNKIIAELVRPNSLYLSVGMQNNHEQLSRISIFLVLIRIDTGIGTGSDMFWSHDIHERSVSFLEAVGTGIRSYNVIEGRKDDDYDNAIDTAIPLSKIGLGEKLNDRIGRGLSTFPTTKYGHLGKDGSQVYLDFETESDGTKRLLYLLRFAFRALDNGTLFISDELNASLHTQACEALVSLFCSRETNPRGAQLIATTHDTNLLQSKTLRRDQIWFTEKTEEGATRLYPLTDIRTRKGDNLEKAYLQGRYGAVAVSGSVKDILSAL
jgi:AAA15 family ATPase/GTPase